MKSKWILMTAIAAGLSMVGTGLAQTPAPKTTDQTASTSKKKAAEATPAPTDSQIADAKAKGMVWVNTHSKVYHQADSRFYGKTKHGKFITEDEAKTAGFKAAKESTAKRAPTATKKSDAQAKK
jgi:hypothetical protein